MEKFFSFLYLSVCAVWIYHRTGLSETMPVGIFLTGFFAGLAALAWSVRGLLPRLGTAKAGARSAAAALAGKMNPLAALRRLSFVRKAVVYLMRENSALRRRMKDLESERGELETELKFVVGQWLKPAVAERKEKTLGLPMAFEESGRELGFVEEGFSSALSARGTDKSRAEPTGP